MDFKLKDQKLNEEFDNFLMKVENVSSIIRGLCSDDDTKAKIAERKADLLLGNDKSIEIDENEIRVKQNKTVINQRAFNEMATKDQPHTMCPEAFMKSVEKDAQERAENRRMRKEIADGFMKRGNKQFRDKEYEKALNMYNKAIDEVRDSCLLYTNRALTCLKLHLYNRVINDCNMALKLNENNMKALLYKAEALQYLGNNEESEEVVKEVLDKHPNHTEYIKDYVSKWHDE